MGVEHRNKFSSRTSSDVLFKILLAIFFFKCFLLSFPEVKTHKHLFEQGNKFPSRTSTEVLFFAF